MKSRSSRTTCQSCYCGECSFETLQGKQTKACSSMSCLNRYILDHHCRMKSNLCSVCDISRLQSSAGPSQARVSPTEVPCSAGPPQDRDDFNVDQDGICNIEWSGLSLNIEDLVRNLDGSNSASKDRTPKLGNDDVCTYVESLKNAYSEIKVDKGYEDLSAEELEQIRSCVNGSHQTVSKWTTERCKGILFRRVHAFIREKLGKF